MRITIPEASVDVNATVSSDGTFTARIRIPTDSIDRTYVAEVEGTRIDNTSATKRVVVVLGVVLTASTPAALAATGAPVDLALTGSSPITVSVLGLVLVLSGIALLAALKRRTR